MTRVEEAWADLESALRFEHWTKVNAQNAPSREARLARTAYEAAKTVTRERRLALEEAEQLEREGDVDTVLSLVREVRR